MTTDLLVPSINDVAADTANLIGAHAALPSTGGTIRLDAGPYQLAGDAVSFTKPVHLEGSGPNGVSAPLWSSFLGIGSRIDCASPTGTAIAVNADGCSFEKLALFNTSLAVPTAGAGIRLNTYGKSTRIVDNAVVGFFSLIDIIQGYEWFISRNQFHDPVTYGIKIQDVDLPDGGDGIISDNSIIAGPTHLTPVAGIQWESGGGLKVVGNKIVNRGDGRFLVGIDYQVGDDIHTGITTVVGNSIENVKYGVLFQLKGPLNTGTFRLATITGNELVATVAAVGVCPAVTGAIGGITITGNVGTAPEFVRLVNTDRIDVGTNTQAAGAPVAIYPGCTDIYLDGSHPFATDKRPAATAMRAGSSYFDTTYSKPAYSNGTVWKDAAGNTWS